MFNYVLTTGGANFQDDYAFYVEFLTPIWNDGWTLSRVLDGAPHGPHFTAIPVFLRSLWMLSGEWSAFSEAQVSLALGVLRVLLVYQIFASRLPSLYARCCLLATASLLIFAPAQVGLYVYGDTGLTMGIDSLGFLLGLWGVARFPATWKGVALAILGGWLSAWAWGMAVTWIVLFLTAFCFRFSRVQLLTVILGGVCVHAPMFQYLDRFVDGMSTGHNFFNLSMIIGALGRPFVPNVTDIGNNPLANCIGGAALVAALVSTLYIARIKGHSNSILLRATPAWALMAWSLLYLYQVSISRTTIGAWYVGLSVYFWISLVALLLLFFGPARDERFGRLAASSTLIGLLAMAGFYIPANQSFDQKTPFLQSRTLSSEACQRRYLSAPTYCEMLLFFWPPTYEFARFSRFFAETGLASLGQHQTWTMQGDFVFNNVWFKESPEFPQVKWIRKLDFKGRPQSWQTHERLNLHIPFAQKAFWKVALPDGTIDAKYKVKIHNPGDSVAVFSLEASFRDSSSAPTREYLVKPHSASEIEIDATEWRGKEVAISMVAAGDPRQPGLVLEYPRIKLHVERAAAAKLTPYKVKVQGIPENTELSPIEEFANTGNDYVWTRSQSIRWSELYANPWTPERGADCAGDYRALKITAAVPVAADIRFFYVLFATRAPNGDYFEDKLQMPLLADGRKHTYTVDLKLLPIVKGDKIEKVRIYSLLSPASNEVEVDFPEIRLVRYVAQGSYCEHRSQMQKAP
ncbi:hypothetical protein J2789_004454 [Variovorax paradoxus]|uniref:hypothetical protein n=1 Tax=Variovorax atrisoli TaxID=3394203 RepID=UPI0011A235D1|nr:hypothetical protein [Variovorax paradoxus]MDR6521764.1 hypothetical protein [Variovorax paradoxus]